MIDRLNEWMNEWMRATVDLHTAHQVISSRWRHELSFFYYTQTTEEEQQEDRRATEEQFAVCLWVKWMCCDWRWLWMKWLELSWSLRRSNLRSVLLSNASSLGSQSFSCIFWNSLAKGIFIKNICPLAISHLVKNKRVYTVLLLLHSLQHRLLYYWTWTVWQRCCACALDLSKKCNSKIKNIILCVCNFLYFLIWLD